LKIIRIIQRKYKKLQDNYTDLFINFNLCGLVVLQENNTSRKDAETQRKSEYLNSYQYNNTTILSVLVI